MGANFLEFVLQRGCARRNCLTPIHRTWVPFHGIVFPCLSYEEHLSSRPPASRRRQPRYRTGFRFIGTRICNSAMSVLTLPPVNSHGYGSISASIVFSPQDRLSITTITCESAAKAMLTQSKYLSDIERLPGVSRVVLPAVAKVDSGSYRTPSGGVIACAARGKIVTIVAANDEARLPAVTYFKANSLV